MKAVSGLNFFFSCALLAVSLSGFSQNYNFHSFSLEEGLSQSEVNCILEDSRGYLWVGTSGGGLNRFDGKNFVSYEEDKGLNGSIVTALAEDKEGNIWIGTTWGGISRFDGSKFTKFSVNEGLLSNNISALLFDDNNNLLIGTKEGLNTYNGARFRNFIRDEKTFVPIKVNCLLKDKKGNVWIGTENGIYIWKENKLVNLSENFRQLNGNVLSMTNDQEGNTWIVQSPKLFFKLHPVNGPALYTLEEIVFKDLFVRTSISAIYFDQRSRFWITTLGEGILCMHNGKQTLFNKTNGLSNNIVASACEDKEGNMWFGTRGEGLMKYRDGRFCYFENITGLKEGDIFAINKDMKGNLWIGTNNNGAYVFDGYSVKSLNSNPDIAESRTSGFYFAPNGEVWIGTSKGVVIYNGSSFRKLKLTDTGDVPLRAIYEDKQGRLWMGTSGFGAIRMNGSKPEFYNSSNGLTNNVYCFAEDGSGKLFMGTDAGLFVYDGVKCTPYLEGLCNSYTGSMAVDKYHHVWVGTDKCVARFDGSKFNSFSAAAGLSSSTIYLMNTDNKGNIWVGTNKGIDRLTVSADGKLASIKNYGRAEGFKGIECNSRATFKDKEGAIYFGTIKGLIRYNPEEDLPDTLAPRVHITNVRVFFEQPDWQKLGDSLSPWFNLPVDHEFSYGQNHLTFDFIGISKSAPEAVQYKFMLEGFDEGWNKPESQSSVTYSNLPAGRYIFRVVARNSDGKWNANPAEFRFSILAPFWRTSGFFIFCAAIISMGIYYYNRIRKLQIQRRNLVLERVVKERTSELQRQKEEREVLLKEIHHRVKNNLQIVNSLINIQSVNIKDPEALAVFEESKNKIKSIALIHERLYRGQDLSSIDIGDYLSELLKSLIDTYSVSREIRLATDLKVKKLNINTVIPLGLLLNEIISNSIKYAFSETIPQPEIYVQLKSVDEDTYEMIIGDNGKGFNADPFAGESATLGLELVKILVSQLDGSIRKMKHEGTRYYIRFKRAKN